MHESFLPLYFVCESDGLYFDVVLVVLTLVEFFHQAGTFVFEEYVVLVDIHCLLVSVHGDYVFVCVLGAFI